MEERRQFRRFPLSLPCLAYAWDQIRGEMLCRAHTSDVSAGGAFVVTEQPLQQGLFVHFELLVKRTGMLDTASRGSCVSLNAHVVQNRRGGMAIVFDGPYQIEALSRAAGVSHARSKWLSHWDVRWESTARQSVPT